jgi:parallel beta-helix repeat protein
MVNNPLLNDTSLLDGVTVEEGIDGIHREENPISVVNCIIENNDEIGIYSRNGNLTVKWSVIKNNGLQGIYQGGGSYILDISNCKIYDNQRDGILIEYSNSTILNSVIYQNGSGSSYFNPYYGINLVNPPSNTTIRNNTIVHNTNEGIRRTGGSAPTVKNNIVYYNNDGDTQLVNISTTWCCVQNCAEVNDNFNDPPDFVYDQPPYGFYHIKYESLCHESGDSNIYSNEKDMDNEGRVQENTVDRGADEVSCEDTWHENDWTYDGVINYEEFSIFSAAWLSRDPYEFGDPNFADPNEYENWNPICNLDDTGDSQYAIDVNDLIAFCAEDNWLWEACWREDYAAVFGIMGRIGGESLQVSTSMAESLEAALEQEVYEPDPETLQQNILLILAEIGKSIEAEDSNLEGLSEIKAFLEEVLWDLQNSKN